MIEIVILIFLIISASILKRNLDNFLSSNNGGEVIDIQFIPNYQRILVLEREKNQLFDLKNLINKNENSFVRKYFYPEIFRTDERTTKKIEEIDNLIQKETENPVESSGHAFVSFDSLLSANKCLYIYEENFCKKLKLRLGNIWDWIKSLFKLGQSRSFEKFDKFNDDILDLENPNSGSLKNKENFNSDKINILVDSMMEPYDIIWTNIGGNRGIYIFRQILIYLLAFFLLCFLTTPTVILFILFVKFFRLYFPH